MWFRRDLRADDNAALYHALKSSKQVYCVFVFDKEILDLLPKADRRVEFIRESLVDLKTQLEKMAGKKAPHLIVRHAWANDEIPRLATELGVQAVFTNHDDEPQAIARDTQVRGALANAGVSFHTYKDHVIFERSEVLTLSGGSYGVFTPYKNAWLKKVDDYFLKAYPTEKYAAHLAAAPAHLSQSVPTLEVMGFTKTNLETLKIPTGSTGGQELFKDFLSRIDRYDETRNFPAVKGPSYLSVHLRFGTVSIRQLAREAHKRAFPRAGMGEGTAGTEGARVWLSELIWRDFYVQILHHHPHVAKRAFKKEYDAIEWEKGSVANALFKAWCDGKTGYPIVDAAMRQLNETGYMHNRLRMVVASFLTKDLGLDWRWGEKYFAEQLNDFDLSANNGGWQWASSSGCDAQPYFRIFNPTSQSEKFDAQGKFIRRYVPELAKLPDAALHAPWDAKPVDIAASGVKLGVDYPLRCVIHDEARAKTLERYSVVKKAAK
ncbi:deoxyribodipyrimidine photo-lyase [Variovorax sp. PCZ-1]|nr:deoxyribodipyrimidine photo-lyase [Variovorax sp. PCZ-1]